jgi:hypothetical protein
MVEIDPVSLQRSFVRRLGFRADQGVGPAAALRNVRGVQFISIDDLVQMSPPMLGERKSQRPCVRVPEEAAKLFAVGAMAPGNGVPAPVRRFLRRMGLAEVQLLDDRRQPTSQGSGGMLDVLSQLRPQTEQGGNLNGREVELFRPVENISD